MSSMSIPWHLQQPEIYSRDLYLTSQLLGRCQEKPLHSGCCSLHLAHSALQKSRQYSLLYYNLTDDGDCKWPTIVSNRHVLYLVPQTISAKPPRHLRLIKARAGATMVSGMARINTWASALSTSAAACMRGNLVEAVYTATQFMVYMQVAMGRFLKLELIEHIPTCHASSQRSLFFEV